MANFFRHTVYSLGHGRKHMLAILLTMWRPGLKPDFHLRFSLVASDILHMVHAQSGETNRIGRKNIFWLCSHLKFKYFNFREIFLHRNQSDFFLESRGHFTRIQKFLQNGHPTALSGLREDRPQYILKTRIIELQTSFRFRWVFAGTLRKWRLTFLLRYFF